MGSIRDTVTGGRGRDFPSTHWSSLLSLHDPSRPGYADHLNHLIEGYWKPVYHYVRALRPVSIEDAKDLTQQFFTMLLHRHDLEKLSEDRGSFRGFLKTALRHFLASADRAAVARQPHDGAHLFRFDEAEEIWQKAPVASPDQAFDREWARGVLMTAVAELEKSLTDEGKETYFKIFRDYCIESGETISYAALAARYSVGEEDVRNYLRHARQRIRAILKDLLRTYLSPEGDVEEELRFILAR